MDELILFRTSQTKAELVTTTYPRRERESGIKTSILGRLFSFFVRWLAGKKSTERKEQCGGIIECPIVGQAEALQTIPRRKRIFLLNGLESDE